MTSGVRGRSTARGLLSLLGLVALLAASAPAAPRPAGGAAPGGPAVAPAAGGSPAGTASAGPRRFTIVLVTPITNYNPYSQSGGDYTTAWQSIFQGLTRLTNDRVYEPLVAERWEAVEPTTQLFALAA